MKTNLCLYALLASLLVSCSSDDGPFSVGEEENTIKLYAGVVANAETGDIATRAAENYVAMQENTAITLTVNGTWTGHTPPAIEQRTTGATKSFVENQTIKRKIECTPLLYWDDYGTADPANAETGRKEGLTIYAVAVDGETAATTVGDFSSLAWSVDENQSGGWAKKDLLISNNISKTDAARYNFSERNDGKLLEFSHAMTKMTVNLTAGKGFAEGKFVTEPTATLHGFPTAGTVDVPDGSLTYDVNSIKDIQTFCTNETKTGQQRVTRTAIVFPGRNLADVTGNDAGNYIIKVEADGNIYYVSADKLKAAMPADKTMKAGVNYILNITVNKTDIEITAAVKDWEDVTAEEDEPVINVTTSVGGNESDKQDGFTSFAFYLSDAAGENAETAYTEMSTASGTKTDGTEKWTFDTPLYWPSHSTHYFMRGVFPTATTVTEGKIAVTNALYNNQTFPSNLLVGAPVIATGTMCGNDDHTQVDMSTGGICAREATVNLTFNYMTTQIEVRLSTPDTGSDRVTLAGAKVEIVDGYTNGTVNIHDKTVDVTGTATDYTVGHVETEDANYRHATVVSQSLTNNDGKDLRFRITLTNTDGTKDIYYTTIKNIKVKTSADATPASISAWEPGKHYIYSLKTRKTEILTSAAIVEWIVAEGEDDVWF